jgi:hypothetical protein
MRLLNALLSAILISSVCATLCVWHKNMEADAEPTPCPVDKLLLLDVPGHGILLVLERALKDYPPCATVQDLLRSAIQIIELEDGTWARRSDGFLDEMD